MTQDQAPDLAGDSPTAAGATPAPRRRTIPEITGLLVVLVALVLFFSIKSPYFLGSDNIFNILVAIAVTGIIAVPATMLIIAGQVDLSVGSGAAFCGVLLASQVADLGLAMAIVLVLVAGIGIGVVNGALVTVLNVNSLITTLGMLAVLRGVTQLLAGGQTMIVPGFEGLGTGRPLGVPMPVVIFLAVVVLGIFLMAFTVFGRSLYAIGANPVAARLVGIRSKRTLLLTFVLSGLAVALAGLILTSQLSAASPVAASGLELTVVTAVVLGGASLAGGRGTILGTIVGLFIIGVLNNGLTLLNVNSFWQDVARGSLLILAVSFDGLRNRFSSTS